MFFKKREIFVISRFFEEKVIVSFSDNYRAEGVVWFSGIFGGRGFGGGRYGSAGIFVEFGL